MISPSSLTPPSAQRPAGNQGVFRHLRPYLLHRIWLPATVYRAVPWIYLVNGSACLAGALYLPDQAWLWPYIALLGLACFHAAYLAVKARRSGRGGRRPCKVQTGVV